jgi:hypothetical protein
MTRRRAFHIIEDERHEQTTRASWWKENSSPGVAVASACEGRDEEEGADVDAEEKSTGRITCPHGDMKKVSSDLS